MHSIVTEARDDPEKKGTAAVGPLQKRGGGSRKSAFEIAAKSLLELTLEAVLNQLKRETMEKT